MNFIGIFTCNLLTYSNTGEEMIRKYQNYCWIVGAIIIKVAMTVWVYSNNFFAFGGDDFGKIKIGVAASPATSR